VQRVSWAAKRAQRRWLVEGVGSTRMCGRFTQAYTWREIVALYRVTQPAVNLQARYNITPTTTIDVVIPCGTDRLELVPMRWGLIPSWWKKTAKEVPSTFNARAETVATKPMFRAAFKRSRCLIPASGYYEWKATPSGKQPYYISAADGSVLSFAGLWDEWHNIENGEVEKSSTIIVTAANDFSRKIHDRMPVIIAPNDLNAWLRGSPALDLLKPAPENALQMWPVLRRVNRVGNDNDPKLTEAIQ
jgi:putative SOS response-associated peptidase YedK